MAQIKKILRVERKQPQYGPGYYATFVDLGYGEGESVGYSVEPDHYKVGDSVENYFHHQRDKFRHRRSECDDCKFKR